MFAIDLKDNFYLAIEDCTFVDNSNISDLISLKPLYCGLTWNYSNAFAGGCFDDGGISSLGKSLVLNLEENGIIVDSAHLNRASFFDLVNISQKPIFNSHTACDALCSTPRNLTDEQIKLIAETNGFIGIYFVGQFLNSGKVSSIDVARHVFHILELVGDEFVGIGTDFNGTDDLPVDIKGYNDIVNIFNHLKD